MNTQKAMTLVEVLVASLILLITIAGVSTVYMNGLKTQKQIKKTEVSRNILKLWFEQIDNLKQRDQILELIKDYTVKTTPSDLISPLGKKQPYETVDDVTYYVSFEISTQNVAYNGSGATPSILKIKGIIEAEGDNYTMNYITKN